MSCHYNNVKAKFFAEQDRLVRVELSMGPSCSWEAFDASPKLIDAIGTFWEDYWRKKGPVWVHPLDFSPCTFFVKRGLLMLKTVPFGKKVTYGELGAMIGTRSARAGGTVCRKNPFPFIIPCHRVLAAGGLGGFSQGLDIKRLLLEHEGLAWQLHP